VCNLLRCTWQIHDLYDYESQPFLLGYQNEDKIKKQGLKKTDFDFKQVIGVSMFGHISLAKHKVTWPARSRPSLTTPPPLKTRRQVAILR